MMTPFLQHATELDLQHPALRAHAKWQSVNASKQKAAQQQNENEAINLGPFAFKI
jgi:hypothetical protein